MTDDAIDPKIRADLNLIRKSLDLKDDSEAAGVAVEVLADHCRHGRLIVSRDELHGMMISYAAHAISVAMGRPMAPVQYDDGTVGFIADDADAPMPEAPAALH